jgi:hypothetical protein
VTKGGNDEDWWTRIGAAFPHQNGEGYNIVPQGPDGQCKIVLRPPKDEDDRREQDRDRETKQAVRQANDRRHGRPHITKQASPVSTVLQKLGAGKPRGTVAEPVVIIVEFGNGLAPEATPNRERLQGWQG